MVVEKFSDLDANIQVSEAYIRVQEADGSCSSMGNPACQKDEELAEENKDKAGVLISVQGIHKDTSAPMVHTSFIEKEELAAMTDSSSKNTTMSLFLKAVDSTKEAVKKAYESSKKFAQKFALFAVIVGSGLLTTQIDEAQARNVATPSVAIEETQSFGPTKEQISAALDMSLKNNICERLTSLNPVPVSYDEFVTPLSEAIRSDLVRLSGEETGEQLNDGEFSFETFGEIQRNKFQKKNKKEWAKDGQDFQKAYLGLKEVNDYIFDVIRHIPLEELQVVLAKEIKGQPSGHLVMQLLAEKNTLKNWMGFTNGEKLPIETILQIIAPDGKNVTLSEKELLSLIVTSSPKMNTVEEREAYFNKHNIQPQEQGRTLLAVDMLKMMTQTRGDEKLQEVFSKYKDIELIDRFRQSVEFAIEDNKPDQLWMCIAIFSKDVDEAKNVFNDKTYAGLYQDERIVEENDDSFLRKVHGIGQRKLGSRGLDGLDESQMVSVLKTMDLSGLRATEKAASTVEEKAPQEKAPQVKKASHKM